MIFKFSSEDSFSRIDGDSVEVSPKLTKITKEEAMDAISGAFSKVFNWTPTKIQSAMLTAQWANETGWGKKMFNYNFAGLKGKDPISKKTTCYGTVEGYGDNVKKVRQYFRAYENAQDGAEDYLNLIKSKNYGRALEALKLENVYSFVSELKSAGYFTGDLKTYYKNILSITRDLAGEEMKALEKKQIALKKKRQIAKSNGIKKKGSNLENLNSLVEYFLKMSK